MNKRGILADQFGLIIGLFILAIIVVVMFIAWSGVNDAIQADDDIPAASKAHLNEWVTDYTSTWDMVFIIYFVGLSLAGFIFLLLIDTSPVFYFFIWFADLFLLYLSAVLANAYATFQSNSNITVYSNQFFFIPFVMSRFLEIMIVISVIYLVIFFVKTRSSVL